MGETASSPAASLIDTAAASRVCLRTVGDGRRESRILATKESNCGEVDGTVEVNHEK